MTCSTSGVCTCNTGFLPDSTATSCVSACPAHASGTPCACDAGYQFDATRTSCIPEQYTISLSGLGGEVMTNTTWDAYALVTTSSGSPKSGVHVDLDLTVIPDDDGQPYGAHVGSVSPNGGTTGADGQLSFVFTAPAAGGIHTITATCTGCTNNPVTGTIKVLGCPIPPLTPLTDPVAIDFDNGNRWHPEGLTPAFQEHLACVEAAITAAHGTYTPTSAYRPEQYQRHLYEIVDKDVDLKPSYMLAHPECQALRDEITGEMGPPPGHHMQSGQDVAIPGMSRHESGTAFDLTPHGLTAAQMAPIYAGCGVSHTAVSGEPWHVQ